MWAALQSTTLSSGLTLPAATWQRPCRLVAHASSRRQGEAVPIAALPPLPPTAEPGSREQQVQQPAAALGSPSDDSGSNASSPATQVAAPTSAAAEPATPLGTSGGSGGGGGFNMSAEAWGKLCLLGVAALWGSYNPLIRLLYSQDGPPGPVAIMLFRGVLQAIVLVGIYSYCGKGGNKEGEEEGAAASSSSSNGIESSSSSNGNGSSSNGIESSSINGSSNGNGSSSNGSSNGNGSSSNGSSSVVEPAVGWGAQLLARVPYTYIAATELGTWLFLATSIQTLGLQLTTATRAGFLIQATALITPLLASFTGEKPSRNVWAGCMVALAGCVAIAADASATDSDDGAIFSLGGDAAILSAAFFFSLATVRLGVFARVIPSVELATAKSIVLGTAALGTFLIAAASMTAAGDPLSDLWPGWNSSPLGWAVLCYAALGPGALAAFLHAKGQSVVPPAEAQVIFSSVPIWSVGFAYLLLGGEPMSEKTILGGAAVVAAGIIASRKPAPPPAVAEEEAAAASKKEA